MKLTLNPVGGGPRLVTLKASNFSIEVWTVEFASEMGTLESASVVALVFSCVEPHSEQVKERSKGV